MDQLPSSKRSSGWSTDPFGNPKWYWDLHNDNNNLILESKYRITPIGRWQWNEEHRLWIGWGQLWNKRNRSWGPPRLFHARYLETENDHI